MTPEEIALKQLIESSREGDDHAFRQLYEVLVDRVFSYTRSRVSSREDALDCTQLVFIELWKALTRFQYKNDPQFYGFVFTITKRVIIRNYHERKRFPELLHHEESVADTPHDSETMDLVMRSLSTLSDLDQEIITLHHWARYTFNEIALMLTLKETAVRVRHHRALQSLKKNLTPYI